MLAGATLLAALLRTVAAVCVAHLLAESRAQARTDDLTKLGNRGDFYERAQQAVDRAGPGGPVSPLLLDLDRSQEVNDSLGHHVEDELLLQVALRLRGGLRPGDTSRASVAMPSSSRCRAPLPRWPSTSRRGSASSCCRPSSSTTPRCTSPPAPGSPPTPRTGGTCQALGTDELVLHYQPQVVVASGAVHGFEAFVRWQPPERRLLHPDAFPPLAEQSGLMSDLSLHVLDRAVTQCAQWHLDGTGLTVSVNLGQRPAGHRTADRGRTVLTRHGLAPATLVRGH